MGVLVLCRSVVGIGTTLLVAGAVGCSFLLDFGSLQGDAAGSAGAPLDDGGGSGGTGGTGPTGGNDASGIDDGASSDAIEADADRKSCASDLDCIDPTSDACVRVTCGADKKCTAPEGWKGPAVEAISDVEKVVEADEIGVPALIADEKDILLAAYTKIGEATNVVLKRYPDDPAVGSDNGDLMGLAPGKFASVSATPALFIESLPRRLRVLVPAALAEGGAVGMHLLWVDIGPGALKLTALQPSPSDLGIAGYDSDPLVTAPQLFLSTLKVKALWVQGAKLFLHDGTAAAEVFSAKKVIDFALLDGFGIHAAIETIDAAGSQATELWSHGSAALAQLIDDDLGPKRHGVSATSTDESGQKINFVGWSYQTQAGPLGRAARAVCPMADACTSSRLGVDASSSVFPKVASARVPGSNIDRDLATTSIFTFVDPVRTKMAVSALIGTLARITTPPAGDLVTQPMNPPAIVIAAASGPVEAPPGTTLGQPALLVSPTGQVMAAWVERPGPAKAILHTRRYRVKVCR